MHAIDRRVRAWWVVSLLLFDFLLPTISEAAKKPDASLLSAIRPPSYAAGASSELIYRRGIMDLEFGRDDLSVIVKVEERTKIYSEAGYDEGTRFLLSFEGSEISDIEACTWTPAGEKVKVSDIHDLTLSKATAAGDRTSVVGKTVVFPSLAVGAVLDLAYTVRQKNFVWIEPWLFQGRAPCRESRFTARVPVGLAYSASIANPRKLTIGDRIEERQGAGFVEAQWYGDQLPALTAEKHGRTIDALHARLYFALDAYAAGGRKVEFWKGWSSLNELVTGLTERTQERMEIARAIGREAGNGSPPDRIRAIHTAVLDRLESSGIRGVGPSRTVDEVLESGFGDDCDRAYALLAALEAADIDAHPTWVCANDLVAPINAALPTQFTDVVIWSNAIGTEGGYVHALDGYDPFLLPARFSETFAFRATPDGGVAVETPASSPNAHTIVYDAELALAENGDLTGRIELTLSGEPAAAASTRDAGSALRTWLREPLDSSVDPSLAVEFDPATGTAHATAEVRAPGFAATTENSLHLEYPFFSNEKAAYDPDEPHATPLFFDSPVRQEERVRLTLPAGWTIVAPPPARSSTEQGRYEVLLTTEGAVLSARKVFEIKTRYVAAESAPALADLVRAAHDAGNVDLTFERTRDAARR